MIWPGVQAAPISLDQTCFVAGEGRVHATWLAGFNSTDAVGIRWALGLSAACGVRFNATGDLFEIFSNSTVIASTASVTFTSGATRVRFRLSWRAPHVTLDIALTDSTARAAKAASSAWVSPTIAASPRLGADSAGANILTGTFSEVQFGKSGTV